MYNLLAHAIIFCTVFSNYILVGSFAFTDAIYLIIVLYLLINGFNGKYKITHAFGFALFFILIIIDFSRFNNLDSAFSQLRFLFGLIVMQSIYFYFKNNNKSNALVEVYIKYCFYFSLIIIIQVFSYYVLKYNMVLDFGFSQREINAANFYEPAESLLYRTGGIFKEPSWFAAFVGPSIGMLHQSKKRIYLGFVSAGLLLSTSSLGFVILMLFIVFYGSEAFKLRFLATLIISALLLKFLLPEIFIRFFEVGEDGGSAAIRVIEPFLQALDWDKFTFFGNNPTFHYSNGQYYFFANTFVFVYLYFGLIGLLFFLGLIYHPKHHFFTCVILILIITEGLYGRIEFWILLSVISLYTSRNLVINTKRGDKSITELFKKSLQNPER